MMSTDVFEIRFGQNVTCIETGCVIYKKPGVSVCKYHCGWVGG